MPCFVVFNLPSTSSANKTGDAFSLNGYSFFTRFQNCFGFFQQIFVVRGLAFHDTCVYFVSVLSV